MISALIGEGVCVCGGGGGRGGPEFTCVTDPGFTLEINKSSDGLVDYCEFETVTICSFVSFPSLFHNLLPFRHVDFPGNFPKFIASFDSLIPVRWANYPFVRLNVNLRRTLDGLFVWTNESSSKNCLHRRTNRRINWDD